MVELDENTRDTHVFNQLLGIRTPSCSLPIHVVVNQCANTTRKTESRKLSEFISSLTVVDALWRNLYELPVEGAIKM